MNQYKELKEKTENLNVPNTKETVALAEELNAFFTEAAKDHAKLPEFIFKEHFLNFFKELPNIQPDRAGRYPEKYTALYAKWIELAGNEYNPVDIIDNNGKTIYTVPGIMAKPNLDLVRNNNTNVGEIVTKANAHTQYLPEKGTRYLEGTLGKITNGLDNSEQKNMVKEWNNILKRYDIKTPEEEKKEEEKQKKKISKVTLEDLGITYD